MGIFNKPKPNSLLQEILDLKQRVSILENENIDLFGAQKMLRDKVLKKFQGKKQKEETEEEDLYNGILLKEGNGAKI